MPDITTEQRNEIRVFITKQKCISNEYYKSLSLHTAYMNMGFNMADHQNEYNKFTNEITLSLYTKLSDRDTDYINDTLTSAIKEYLR